MIAKEIQQCIDWHLERDRFKEHHHIDRYDIIHTIELLESGPAQFDIFFVFVYGEKITRKAFSLDEALLVAMGYFHEGVDSNFARYAKSMLGMK